MRVSPMFPTLPADAEDDRLRLVCLLLNDRDWRCPSAVRRQLLRILAGAADAGEAAWMVLAEETAHYVDFRRMAKLEARLRGCPRETLRFSRGDWERARDARTVSACIDDFHCARPCRTSIDGRHR